MACARYCRRWPAQQVSKCRIGIRAVVVEWIGRKSPVEWTPKQSELNLASHVRTVKIGGPFLGCKPDRVEVVAERVRPRELPLGGDLAHAWHEQSQMVIQRTSCADQREAQEEQG